MISIISIEEAGPEVPSFLGNGKSRSTGEFARRAFKVSTNDAPFVYEENIESQIQTALANHNSFAVQATHHYQSARSLSLGS